MSVDKTNRNRLFLILGIGLFLRLLWAFMRWDWLQVVIYDDAFYYFAIAKTFVQTGMVSADGITLTNGFHPLWFITVLPIWLLGLPDLVTPLRLVMIQAAVFDTLAAYLIFRVLLQYGQKVALWGAGLYFLNPVVLVQSMSGMETPLVAALMALWVYVVCRHKGLLEIGIVGGLLCLARTDMVFLVFAGYIYMWWKGRTIPLRALVTTFLIVLPWAIWNYLTFGTFVQASGSTYPWIFHNEWIEWFNLSYFGKDMFWKLGDLTNSALSLTGAYFGGAFLFVVFMALIRKHIKTDLLWVLCGTGIVILIHTYIRWFPRVWYFHTLYIALVLMIAPAMIQLRGRSIALLATWVTIGMIFTLGRVENSTGAFARAYVTQQRAMIAEEIIAHMPGGSIAGAWNSGYPQYFAPDSVTVINLDGLANNEVIDYYRSNALMRYLDYRGITYVVDNSLYMTFSFGKYIEKDQRSRVRTLVSIQDIGRPGNDMCAFRIESKEFVNEANQDER